MIGIPYNGQDIEESFIVRIFPWIIGIIGLIGIAASLTIIVLGDLHII